MQAARLPPRGQGSTAHQRESRHLALRQDFYGSPRWRAPALRRLARPRGHRRQPRQLLQTIQRHPARLHLHPPQRAPSQDQVTELPCILLWHVEWRVFRPVPGLGTSGGGPALPSICLCRGAALLRPTLRFSWHSYSWPCGSRFLCPGSCVIPNAVSDPCYLAKTTTLILRSIGSWRGFCFAGESTPSRHFTKLSRRFHDRQGRVFHPDVSRRGN